MSRGVSPYMRKYGISKREWDMLDARARFGSTVDAASVLNISPQTAKNLLLSAYRHLGVHSGWEAYMKLGWLVLPNGPDDYPPFGTADDEITLHGHRYVHVTGCLCMQPLFEVDDLEVPSGGPA